jgi:transcriptional regulator with XRE-family HTH domain
MYKLSLFNSPTDVLKDIAKKLRALRKSKKMSQSELSDRSGVSLGSVKRFEQTGNISLLALLKLTHVLGRLDDFDSVLLPEESNEDINQLFDNEYR